MEKNQHVKATAAQSQRHNTHATGFEAVAYGDIARERAQRGRLMVAPAWSGDAPVQCSLLVNVTVPPSEPALEPYAMVYDYLSAYRVGDLAFDEETGDSYVFTDVRNPALPVLRNRRTGATAVYDAARDRWQPAPQPSLLASPSLLDPPSSVSSSLPTPKRKSRWDDASSATASDESGFVKHEGTMVEMPLPSPSPLTAPKRSKSRWGDASSANPSGQSGFVKHEGTMVQMPVPSPFASLASPSPSPFLSSSAKPQKMEMDAMPAVKAPSKKPALSSASSAPAKAPRYKIQFNDEAHFTKHMFNIARGQSHSVFIGSKAEVWAITEEAIAYIKGITAGWSSNANKRFYSFDTGRIIGFQGELTGAASGYPMTTHVEGYFNFKINAETGERTIFLTTAYPGGPYDQGTLDANGYRLNDKDRAVKKS